MRKSARRVARANSGCSFYWQARTVSKNRQARPRLEVLEDRLTPSSSSPAWNNFGGNAQHTDVATVASQPIDRLMWETPLDLAPWGYIHYGDPVFTANNVVIVPIKVTWDANNQGATNFIEVGFNDVTGAVLWSTAPLGSITGASNVGNTIVITTNNTNGLSNGSVVTIGDMTGDTAANTGSSNKTYTISNVTSTSFTLDNVTGNGTYTGGGTWVLPTSASTSTSYIEPDYGWLPPNQAAYDPVTDRVYFPGPGGTIDYVSNPDTATGVVTPVQEAFYGTSNYTNSPSAYNSSIFINTPVTVDSQGNIYFGYNVTGTNPSGITEAGIARISASGADANVSAFAAAHTDGQTPTDDGKWTAALGSAPALSNDGSILYVGVDDGGYSLNGNEYNSYLVGLNSATLAPLDSVHLNDPTTGNGAGLIDASSASPMVAPDGSVFMGVFGNPYNGSRGYLLHFYGNLGTEDTPGAFGWDDTASIIPTSMVPSYTGTSSYLILSKYNNYDVGGTYGGNGVNEIAVLDPYATQSDPNYDPQVIPVMKQIMTMTSPSPDEGAINSGYYDGTREWCTNGTAVDPATDSIYVNNEDGYTYQWDLGTNTIINTVEVSKGYGVPYTPTAISPNGEVFSDNGGTLFALGGYSNYTISDVSSANPAVVGNAITLTTTVTSTVGGPTPTGTVTFTAYSGANNPLNYNTTPISLGGPITLVNGVATLTLSSSTLPAAHYHITATYSGDSTDGYAPGQTTFVLPVLAQTTTTVSSSGTPSTLGSSVTFTATVTPTSTSFVPLGTVTFKDGSTVLGTVTLNPYNGQAMPNTYNQATLTTSALPVGNQSITAIYSGDLNFTSGTSSPFVQDVQATTSTSVSSSANPSTYGQSVSFTANVANTSGTGGVPTGTVTFYNGSTALGTRTLSSGAATITLTTLTVGTDSITATYNGSANFAGSSTPSAYLETVHQDTTSTSVVASTSANPALYGQSLTFSATVSNTSGTSAVPTGTVTFFNGSTALGTRSLYSGTATLAVTTLPVGTDSITAAYNGTVNFVGSSSPSAYAQTVHQAATSTSVVSPASSNPSSASYGQSLSFTATVTDASSGSSVVPSGTVTFYNGTTALGTRSLYSGTATITLTTLPAGTDSITATYTGTVDFTKSSSPSAYAQTVNQATTSTSVVSPASTNPSPASYGQSLTFTATVTNTSAGSAVVPTGTVTFYNGTTALGTRSLYSGTATIALTTLPVGTDSITATYNGSVDFTSSVSPSAYSQTINKATTSTSVVSPGSGNSNPSIYGQSLTFTATVSNTSSGSSVVPTGTVTFYNGTTALGTRSLFGGTATITLTTLPIGTDAITATYNGTVDFTGSSSPSAYTQTVNFDATVVVNPTSTDPNLASEESSDSGFKTAT